MAGTQSGVAIIDQETKCSAKTLRSHERTVVMQ